MDNKKKPFPKPISALFKHIIKKEEKKQEQQEEIYKARKKRLGLASIETSQERLKHPIQDGTTMKRFVRSSAVLVPQTKEKVLKTLLESSKRAPAPSPAAPQKDTNALATPPLPPRHQSNEDGLREPPFHCKIALFGSTAKGNTCLVNRFIHGCYANHMPTIGAAFLSKKLIVDTITFSLEMWDTAGQGKCNI